MAGSYYSPFTLQQQVHIDDDSSITASVTAITFRTTLECQIECSWIQDGQSRVALIEAWRIKAKNPTTDDLEPF